MKTIIKTLVGPAVPKGVEILPRALFLQRVFRNHHAPIAAFPATPLGSENRLYFSTCSKLVSIERCNAGGGVPGTPQNKTISSRVKGFVFAPGFGTTSTLNINLQLDGVTKLPGTVVFAGSFFTPFNIFTKSNRPFRFVVRKPLPPQSGSGLLVPLISIMPGG